ncbi:MAG TPA: hypothetical protein VH000_09340 [Rhizomicrobium sp.]|jgi:hypothetical protein|nr:hypothetical protein [Rhizomicrobium sp.]
MRTNVLCFTFVAALSLCATANAAEMQSATAGQDMISAPIAYSGTGSDAVTCQLLTHQGDLVRVEQCHTNAGWERLRHRTQEAIVAFQIHSLVMFNR